MSHRDARIRSRAKRLTVVAGICAAAFSAAASAQSEGGLYIAGGAGFTFQQAAEQGMAKNPGGQRFFLLVLPPQTRALYKNATGAPARARDRVIAANAVLFVCQRDIDNGRIDAGNLVDGVSAVRGWPRVRSPDLPLGERYFKGEDSSDLPASNNALRRLRSTCAED
jgi:hypothetical protein